MTARQNRQGGGGDPSRLFPYVFARLLPSRVILPFDVPFEL